MNVKEFKKAFEMGAEFEVSWLTNPEDNYRTLLDLGYIGLSDREDFFKIHSAILSGDTAECSECGNEHLLDKTNAVNGSHICCDCFENMSEYSRS